MTLTTPHPPTPSDPPYPWMFVRLIRPGEHDHLLAIDACLRKELSSCERCAGIFQQTGLVPVSCHVCGAVRDGMWLACIEQRAREDPHPALARPAIATSRLILREIG